MRAFAKQHSLPLYFAFACAWFWGCIALGYIQTFHFWVPLLGALAPALSELAVTSMAEGEPAVRELGRSLRKWARRLAISRRTRRGQAHRTDRSEHHLAALA